MQVRDREAAEEILGVLLRMADVPVAEREYRGHVLNVISGQGMPISPAFTVLDDRLLASISVGGLKTTLRRLEEGGGGSVLASANFQETFHGLDMEDAAWVSYVDLKRLAAFGHNAAENLLPAMVDADELPVDLYMLPSQEVILRHLHGWGEVGRADQDGLVYRMRSISMASLLALGGRFLNESPGCPPFLMMSAATDEYYGGADYGAWDEDGWAELDAEWHDEAPVAAPVPQPAVRTAAPSGIVNPVAAGDPREAELREEAQQLTLAIEADPQNGQLYFGRAIALGQVREHEEAVADYVRARELGFNMALCAYNLACTHSLMSHNDTALEWLQTAFDEGFQAWEFVDHDSDLDNVRKDPRFDELVSSYRDANE